MPIGNGEYGLIDAKDGVAWTDFGNTYYYRYTFHYGTYYLTAAAAILIYICLAYKNTRVIYEIFVSRILVGLYAANLSSSRKVVKILESIRDSYFALCFTAISLKSYFLLWNTSIPRQKLTDWQGESSFYLLLGVSLMERIS